MLRRIGHLAATLATLACSGGLAPGKGPSVVLSGVALADLHGRSRSLAEFRGKVVLIDFWATWCEPCKRSLPVYARWQIEFGSGRFVVLAVSVDSPEAPVDRFVAEHAPGLLVLRDPGGVLAARFELETLPASYLVSPDGSVVSRSRGAEAEDLARMRADIEAMLASIAGPEVE